MSPEDSVLAERETQDNNFGWDINLGGALRWWTGYCSGG